MVRTNIIIITVGYLQDGQAPTQGKSDIMDRIKLNWLFVRDLKSTLGGRGSGCSITTTTHASVEGRDGLVGGGGAWSRQGNVDVYASWWEKDLP